MNRTAHVACALLLASFLPSCGSTGHSSRDDAQPISLASDEARPLETAGARCSGGVCACRAVDDLGRSLDPHANEGAIAPGEKRFELRTGRGFDPIAITVEDRGTLHKSLTSVEPTCGYIDLPPGRHHIRVRAQAKDPEAGMVPSFFLSEYSYDQQSWYDTFQFRCGGDEVCMLGHMQQWLQKIQATPRGIFDKCGSARVFGVRWDAGRSSGAKLGDITIDLVLDVYKFPPRFRHGAPTCKGPTPQAPPPPSPAAQ
ncbi:MAG TPA: hypothetical protein VII38_13675 [Polyangia bacterium]|jgi:hypothetical protein